jgi:hypothetical protein
MIKILAQGKQHNHIAGFKPCVEIAGNKWIWWDENHTPAFDVFDEIKPDIFLGVGELSRAVEKCLKSFECQYIIQFAEYSYSIHPTQSQLDTQILTFPILIDDITFYPGKPQNKFKTDILCYGITSEPDIYFMALCGIEKPMNVKLIGNYRWPLIEYAGQVNQEEKIAFIQSSKLIYCQTLGEVAQALACQKLPVTGGRMWDILPELCFNDPIHFAQWCNAAIADEEIINHELSMIDNNIIQQTYTKAYSKILKHLGRMT